MGDNRIRYVSPSGVISTIAGSGTKGLSGDGGLASASVLNRPFLGSDDGLGGWLISDAFNYMVRFCIVPWVSQEVLPTFRFILLLCPASGPASNPRP